MKKFLLDFFWHVDDPPDRIGVIGFVILATFTLFAAFMWFHHTVR